MAINTDWASKDCRDCVHCKPLDKDEDAILIVEVMLCKKLQLKKPTFNACHSFCPKRN